MKANKKSIKDWKNKNQSKDKNKNKIKNLMRKCFNNINKLKFNRKFHIDNNMLVRRKSKFPEKNKGKMMVRIKCKGRKL